MPNTVINTGRLLILIGVIGYVISMANARTSVTALIPAFFGIVFLLLGYLARAKEGLRKHVMHGAVLLAIIGLLAVAGRLVSKIGEFSLTPAYIAQVVTALVFLGFIIMAVRSFISARKASS